MGKRLAANGSGPRLAFGPEAPGWGSWDWVGADLMAALSQDFQASSYVAWVVPDCDVLVVVKHLPPPGWEKRIGREIAIVYVPVDVFGDASEIDAAASWLRRCDRVLVHCERLRKYFEPYARVEYIDHHVKFAAPPRAGFREAGDFLWVGVRSNLPPLVDWVNAHSLPGALDVLTNFEDPARPPTPSGLGFRPGAEVRVHDWSPRRQVDLTTAARAAIDIKGADFRSRHKPPAKGIDFIASGVPLAMNPDSSTAEHLGRMGFELADPRDAAWWLSREYWEETRRFGAAARELLSRERVAWRLERVVLEVLAERGGSRFP